ncbi:protein-L-isoaspartate(D-aspartate) O-methyltransferase [Moellerella wisconsensis]|uniref:Protein-L-isoaspartate(D-aspartate) O-methyltransferase n=2 Tax=Moellerella wisconsensis TaxID=158849 RepID=A0ACD3Y8H6_9GAMM|nr:protein-L-isoaspartate(D-aspartate) O-methyltransferase [Moellerella wisconsensis]UNH24741.1 protein-L-isoaspartate(D-aspartate) O-methyltransferase [Moellerella wisconsensis]UNH27848.1 protein-L-isoaspartate(D-aspartate) O-methyltransferase [Moellerella wisconsensis]UNH31344.1 protein-L-isoaspartate(D-aspartate) O-methyltransferase [Moellerella wisconsensis]UNH39467.1 protein-L-isoaspartate(D-aspartate) O-methyltransferase [Moellerella wisconsensis]UNH42992.1 protein-L-isoaspartate(D-aspar
MISGGMRELLAQLHQQGINDERLLEAISQVPRERFVDEALAHKAYDNMPLPIGHGQTISQPYIVAKMTALLALQPTDDVLEIGTGSGYQTAILAHLARHIYSVERVKVLQWNAKRRFKQLDLHNISTRHGDGWQGWASKGPFDAIIVTAAPAEMPMTLLQQLKPDGRLILPVGGDSQILKLIVRRGNDFHTNVIEKVRFVPLIPGELA